MVVQNTHPSLYGSAGIIFLSLTDPLSSLLFTIYPSHNHAIGYYYISDTTYYVSLFNVFDTNHIPWLKYGSTLDIILSSPFVSQITLYPIFTSYSTHFIAQAIHIADSFPKPHPILSYSHLLKSCFLQQSFDLPSGFTIVNTLLYQLLNPNNSNSPNSNSPNSNSPNSNSPNSNSPNSNSPNSNSSNPTTLIYVTDISNKSLIISPLLQEPITIKTQHVQDQNQIDYVVNETKKEISNLAGVFVNLFTTDNDFRHNICNFTMQNKTLSKILTELQTGLDTNVISIPEINQHIDLEQYHLHSEDKRVEIINHPSWCSLYQDDTQDIEALGVHIRQLQTKTIGNSIGSDMERLIELYNNIAIKHKIAPITKTKTEINLKSDYIQEIDNTRLQKLLYEVEDLRQNTKSINYIDLQNKITKELAYRQVSL